MVIGPEVSRDDATGRMEGSLHLLWVQHLHLLLNLRVTFADFVDGGGFIRQFRLCYSNLLFEFGHACFAGVYLGSSGGIT